MRVDDAEPGRTEVAGYASDRTSPVRLSAYRGFGLLALYFGAQVAVAVVAGIVYGIQYAIGAEPPFDSEVIAKLADDLEGPLGVISAILGGLLFIWLTLSRHRGTQGAAFRTAIGLTRASPRKLLEGAVCGVALAVLYIGFAVFIWPPDQSVTYGPLGQMARTPGMQQQIWMFFALFGSPPIEEFVFRGVLLASILVSWGPAWAVILTTTVFVGMHYPEFSGYWPAAVAITALSLAATSLRVRSGSLGPAVAAHLGYNLVMVAVVAGRTALAPAT